MDISSNVLNYEVIHDSCGSIICISCLLMSQMHISFFKLITSNHISLCSYRMFGFVAKGVEANMENVCHVFAEYDPLQPCSEVVKVIQAVASKP